MRRPDRSRMGVMVVVAVQILCAVFFVANILMSVLGLAPISWQVSELIELGAAFGLLLGVIVGIVVLRRTLARSDLMESRLQRASGAFMAGLYARFDEWQLTPAERDVALFAIKGLSGAEIAALRGVSEGTVKAQSNAIYRKAGVSGRGQLLSLFLDDLMVLPTAAQSAGVVAPVVSDVPSLADGTGVSAAVAASGVPSTVAAPPSSGAA
ncbi:regulatory protein, luxR family [Loktanella fryxellensis]|uniref:Regulatory protein, luxR family n=1 Tax=Loktanella fryxellensis TaxID=245187 RepID=A0A1H8A9W6_9RHOB|nr:LuxR C-terminal-related transcriptional regulator [Loktanella fryxellensis]SEM67672.1 regulatory protein, luxR family [Loktanella fryxellensis]